MSPTVFTQEPKWLLWIFRLVQNACHVAHPINLNANALSDILTDWFGERVGTVPQQVRFVHLYDGWRIEPIGGLTPSFQERFEIPYYRPDNLAFYPTPSSLVRLPFIDEDDPLLFCMHADDESMSEEHAPIQKGDWLIFKKLLNPSWSILKNKVVLLETSPKEYILRRIVLLDDGYALQNGLGSLELLEDQTMPIAILMQTIQPLELIPPVKSALPDEYLMEYLGLSEKPKLGINKIDGLCFMLENSTNQIKWSDTTIYQDEMIYHLKKEQTHWIVEPLINDLTLQQMKNR